MKKTKGYLELAMTMLILAGSFYIGQMGARLTSSDNGRFRRTVVVDAGHGGVDAGKVGVNGLLEKDLNLAIARKLKSHLENEGICVVMTREGDAGLYDEGASNKKRQDMKRRCEKIDEEQPAAAVSIHQNSYTQESVRGPQVFFFHTSKEAEELAREIQNAMNETLEVERPREIKANDTYYLLQQTKSPTVIVECGFLSNFGEARLLAAEEYQEKVAEAICRGILEYVGG